MNKTLILYISTILIIGIFSVLMNYNSLLIANIEFPSGFHVLLELITSVIMFLIFLSARKLHSKTQDCRFLIISGGYFVGLVLYVIHIFTVPEFPFDNLSFANIQKNPTLVYLAMSWLIQPLSVYYALIYKSKLACGQVNSVKIYNIYMYLLFLLLVIPVLIYYYLPTYLMNLYVFLHSLEFINYAMFLMLAAIIMNLHLSLKEPFLDKLLLGFLILGLSGIFYINPMLIPARALVAHIFQTVGVLFILLGLPQLQTTAASFRLKDELIAYLSLFLILFYVVIVAVISSIFNIIFPQASGYIFIGLLLLFQLVFYAFSTAAWNKVAGIYISAERDRVLIKILESMRRGAIPAIIKNTVIEEVSKDFCVDKCFIALFDEQNKSLYYDRYIELLPSKTLADFDDLYEDEEKFNEFLNIFKNIEINFDNLEDYLSKHSLNGTSAENILKELNLKSLYTIPISFDKKILGYLILHFTQGSKSLSSDDRTYLSKLASQIGIAMETNKKN